MTNEKTILHKFLFIKILMFRIFADFFLKISPASAQVAAYRRTPARRGRDRHTGFRIATRFPFGLFEKSREVEAEGELIIYPAVDPVRLGLDEAGRRMGGDRRDRPRRRRRDLRAPADARRRRSSRHLLAQEHHRSDQIILRERARETRPDVELSIDVVRPTRRRARRVRSAVRATHPRGRVARGRAREARRRRRRVDHAGRARPRRRSLGADPVLRFLALLDLVDEPVAAAERASRLARHEPPPRAPSSPQKGAEGGA